MSIKKPIEISGVWLPNKGAELMMWAVLTELRSRLPDIQFARELQGSFELRSPFGVRNILQNRRFTLKSFLMSAHNTKFKNQLGLTEEKDIDTVVDISGFAYGDFWGLEKARNRAGGKLRSGKRVCLLPQAYGPFSDAELAEEMRFISANADLIYARDNQSLDHIDELSSAKRAVLMPDITFGLDPLMSPAIANSGEYGCLIPNSKLIQSNIMGEHELLEMFTRAGSLFRDASIEPVVLLHEPGQDAKLAQSLAGRIDCRVVHYDDARMLKAYISQSTVVVTGRFHGLVSGLSCGVPTLAVGWSHKYSELLEDFGLPDFVCGSDKEAFYDQIDLMLRNKSARSSSIEQIRIRSLDCRERLKTMWDEVAHVISDE